MNFDIEYDLTPTVTRQLTGQQIRLSSLLGYQTDTERSDVFITLVRGIVQTDRGEIEGIVTWVNSSVPSEFEEV
jgi:hypothetical protein